MFKSGMNIYIKLEHCLSNYQSRVNQSRINISIKGKDMNRGVSSMCFNYCYGNLTKWIIN